jgi:hypothetical protein
MPLTVRARVKNGRLVLDEPTHLPEGTEVELSTARTDDGWMLDQERSAELQARVEAADRGDLVPAARVLGLLRRRSRAVVTSSGSKRRQPGK